MGVLRWAPRAGVAVLPELHCVESIVQIKLTPTGCGTARKGRQGYKFLGRVMNPGLSFIVKRDSLPTTKLLTKLFDRLAGLDIHGGQREKSKHRIFISVALCEIKLVSAVVNKPSFKAKAVLWKIAE